MNTPLGAAFRRSTFYHKLKSTFMRMTKASRLVASLCLISLGLGCSPRDFLKRRLAADLIAASDTFKAPQFFRLQTGIVSNKDFGSPDSMVLQRHGWIIGVEQKKCPEGISPPPCWDVLLTPLGVDTMRPLLSNGLPDNGPMEIPVAQRELVNISGISKAGNFADVEFIWRWVSINQVGAALYDSGVHYRSTVGFRNYDDGWRVMEEAMPSNQPLDEALRNAQATEP
jgi:hypothetical protein